MLLNVCNIRETFISTYLLCLNSSLRTFSKLSACSFNYRYGVTPTTDMEVVRSEPETAPGADPVFTVGEMTESGVLFKGTHVSEVLAGALNGGLPIEGFEGDSLDRSVCDERAFSFYLVDLLKEYCFIE